jgi:hypothetical protein
MSEAVVIGAKEIVLTDAVVRELREGRMLKMIEAQKLQRMAAKAGGERFTMSCGEMRFQVQPEFFHYWGQRLGYECWDNKEFVREFLRDNPECRVKNIARKPTITVGYVPQNVKSRMVFA